MPTPAKASRRAAKSPARAYAAVAARLTADIAAGRHRVGGRLPTEDQIAQQFAVSRSTVRAALALLEDRGMLLRRPRIGTVVKASAPANRYTVAVGSLSELLEFLDSTLVTPVDVREIAATAALAAELGCAIGTRWIRVRTLRTPGAADAHPGGAKKGIALRGAVRKGDAAPLPISWTEYYLQPRFAGVVTHIGRRPGPVYPLLERRHGVAIERMEQDIGACAMPASIARRLATAAGSPALRVIHRMVSADAGTLYCTISLYPADRFRYVQALRRTG
jgi:GntR family transcriptional regulator